MPQQSIDSVEALYRKLVRTFYRREAYGDQQVDWVFDLSVTAWHLVDWTAHDRGASLLATQKAFRVRCPQLGVCEQVCNGAKHRVLANRALLPFNISTDVRSTTDLIGISRMNVFPGDTDVEVRMTEAVSVTDKNGRAWEAVQLFLKVLRFWEQELGLPLDAGS